MIGAERAIFLHAPAEFRKQEHGDIIPELLFVESLEKPADGLADLREQISVRACLLPVGVESSEGGVIDSKRLILRINVRINSSRSTSGRLLAVAAGSASVDVLGQSQGKLTCLLLLRGNQTGQFGTPCVGNGFQFDGSFRNWRSLRRSREATDARARKSPRGRTIADVAKFAGIGVVGGTAQPA